MNLDLMIDTLSMITQKSQSCIEQVMRKNKPLSDKLRHVSLHLNELKSQLFEWISNVLNSNLNPSQITKKLSQLKTKTDEQLAKHRLHIILKKKLNKLKKQSFLHSMQSNQSHIAEESRISELQKSVIHIGKDLNLQHQDEEKFGVQSIISRSRMTLDPMNMSAISEYEGLGFTVTRNQANYETIEHKVTPKKLDQKLEKESTVSQFKTNFMQSFLKQNSLIKPIDQQISTIQPKQEIPKQNKPENIESDQIVQKPQIQSKKPIQGKVSGPVMKKKKKSIYTSLGTGNNLSKQDLLGNLLEDAYQSCLQGQTK